MKCQNGKETRWESFYILQSHADFSLSSPLLHVCLPHSIASRPFLQMDMIMTPLLHHRIHICPMGGEASVFAHWKVISIHQAPLIVTCDWLEPLLSPGHPGTRYPSDVRRRCTSSRPMRIPIQRSPLLSVIILHSSAFRLAIWMIVVVAALLLA